MTYIKRYIKYIYHVIEEMFSIKKTSTTLLPGSAAMQILYYGSSHIFSYSQIFIKVNGRLCFSCYEQAS